MEKTNNTPKYNKEECIKSFTKYVITDYHIENLRQFSIIGKLDNEKIRAMTWRIYLGLLPENKSIYQWAEILEIKRREFKKIYDEIKKQEKFLSQNSVLNLINLDLDRTFQELSIFHDKNIKQKLSEILLIWDIENSDIGYQQGMNDILSVLFLGFYPYYFPCNIIPNYKKPEKINSEEYYLFFHNEQELYTDLYLCFNIIMQKGLKELFLSNPLSEQDREFYYTKYKIFPNNLLITQNNNLQNPLNIRSIMLIQEKLKNIDFELYQHFENIGLNCVIFLQRWIKCIFNREFNLEEVFIIWDNVLSSFDDKEKYNLIKIDFIALSMLIRIRNILLLCDQNQCFMILLQYPRVDNIVEIIVYSNKLQEAVLLDLINGRKSLFLENILKNNIDNIFNNFKENQNKNIEKKNGILPIKSYDEGVERLRVLYCKYHSMMEENDGKELLNILHFFNNYQ